MGEISMNVQPLATQDAARAAFIQYRKHRDVYDKMDLEIERIYRAISKGKLVISARQAIVGAGFDMQGRPRLAICKAHAESCIFRREGHGEATFGIFNPGDNSWQKGTGRIRIPWPQLPYGGSGARALLPRIPPQYRPTRGRLALYHILWEADWQDLPKDPMLLKRIGNDAWVVVAAWDLTDVELSVLREHRSRAIS